MSSKHVFSYKPISASLFVIHGVCGGVEEICVGFQQWSVAGSEALEEDRVHSVGCGHAVLGQGEPSIPLPLSVNLPVVDL